MTQRVLVLRAKKLLHRLPVRLAGWLISVTLVIGGLYVIVRDHPANPGRYSYFGLNYTCPRGTELYEANVPDIDVNLTDDGYEAVFSGALFSQGPGTCVVHLTLPTNAHRDIPYSPRDGSMRLIKAGAAFSDEAVGNAPPYTKDWRKLPNGVMSYSFSSHLSNFRTGWGKRNFVFDSGVVAVGGEVMLPTLAPPDEPKRAYDLSVVCPEGEEMSDTFPGDGARESLDETRWHVPSALLPDLYTGTCQNAETRFLVDHASDAIVLGMGAILGLLVAFRKGDQGHLEASGRKDTDRSAQPPANSRSHGQDVLWTISFLAFTWAWRRWSPHRKTRRK